jgi:ribosomal protein L7Ae-like RNA K-turn-binding protein
MTLSYAEAMKRKAQPASSDTTSSSSVRKPIETSRSTAQSSNTQHTRVKAEPSSASAWVKPVPTSTPVWPKAPPTRTVASVKQEPTQSTRQSSNPASKTARQQPNRQDNVKTEDPVPTGGGNWKTIGSNPKQSKPTAVNPKRVASVNKAKKNSQKDATPKVTILTKQQKSSKPKPTLRTMSINDLISPPRKGRGGKTGTAPTPALLERLKTPQVNSSKDFPALSASSQSTRTQAHKPLSNWGKAAGPKTSKAAKKDESKASKMTRKRPTKKESGITQNSKGISNNALAAMFFKPQEQERRLGDGDEHQLFRLMQERTVYQKKGRQRVAPRKKKFTALKKKVLQERLKKWRELNPEEENVVDKTEPAAKIKNNEMKDSCSVCLYNYASTDDFDDDDEYNEIVDNLKEMATKIGEVDQIFVPRKLDRSYNYPAFVKFKTIGDASAAKACWDGLVVGGETLKAVGLDESSVADHIATEWRDKMLAAESSQNAPGLADGTDDESATEVVVENVLTEDDYNDQECMEESLNYLKQLGEKFGNVSNVLAADGKDGNVLVLCRDSQSAQAIVNGLSSTIISGNSLSTFVQAGTQSKKGSSSLSTVILENVLTEDDIEDEDCLSETLNDVRELAGRHGEIASVAVDGRIVKVFFAGNLSVAQSAASELDGMCLGGMVVSARVESNNENKSSCVYLENLLTEDDLEDNDCLEESLGDIRQLVSKYGEIFGIEVIRKGISGIVKVIYNGAMPNIEKDMKELDGMVVGGQIISASFTLPGETGPENEGETQENELSSLSEGKRKTPGEAEDSLPKKARTGDKTPLYSGDKLIPEFFAECKRAPKVPNSTGPREYAKIINDERVRPLLTEMLSELMRLQKRAIEDKNAKARRRLVMGLREVARGIRAHKVKMVVMANNLDQYGAIDEKLQEIIDLAHSEDVPLFFEFTKRSLGKAIGKSIKVAVVGIQNADGAHQAFKKLSSIA